MFTEKSKNTVSGWSQSGTLTAGLAANTVSLQVNFPDDSDAVHTIQFGVTPATTLSRGNQTIQPSPTPPNPPITGKVTVTNGSPNIVFTQPQSLNATTAFIFSSQPNRVYQLASTIIASLTGVLTLPYNGPSLSNVVASIAATAPIPPAAPAPGPAKPIDVVAIIQFTVEGNKVQRIISVGNGTSISGPGEALQVIVLDNTTYTESAGYTYDVTIQVTPGVRAAVQPPTLYWSYPPPPAFPYPLPNPQNVAILVGPFPGNIIVIVPPNAGVISLDVSAVGLTVPGPSVPPNITIRQLTITNDTTTVSLLGSPGTFIPVLSNTSSVQLINNDPVNNVLVNILWGIDG